MNTPNTTDGSYSAANEVTLVKARRSVLQNIWRTLKTAPPTAWFGMVVITFYLIVALFASLLAPHGQAQVFPMAYAPWSEEFILGTDALGRDVFSRLIYGAQNTIGIAVATTLLGGYLLILVKHKHTTLRLYVHVPNPKGAILLNSFLAMT